MRNTVDRAVLTIVQQEGSWAVEFEGQLFGQSIDKEVTKAAAHKRARQMQDGGRPCQIRITGEPNF